MVNLEYNVRQIPAWQTYEWILKKHYAHRLPSISYAFGIYNDNNLQGISTIGKPASNNLCEGICGKEYSHLVYELNRLCLIDNEKNLASYFISRIIKILHDPMILVSYADTGYNHVGYIYQASNFIYTGSTCERTDIARVGSNAHSRHYQKASSYPNRQMRTSKHRYVYFVKCSKAIKSSLRYKILPYPKGDNVEYNADYKPTQQGCLF